MAWRAAAQATNDGKNQATVVGAVAALPFRRAKGVSFTDDFGVARRVCGPCASTEYRRRRRAGRFSGAAAAAAGAAAWPATPAFGFLGAGTPPPRPASLLSMVRDTTCDPGTSSGTALTPPGLGLSLGSPADVSSAAVAAPAPPPSSDGATPDGTAATTAGRPDTGRMPALGGPRTAWRAEEPCATSVGPPSCHHPWQATPTGDRYLSDSTRAAQQLKLGSVPHSGAPCDADPAAQTGDEAKLGGWVLQTPAPAILLTSTVPPPAPRLSPATATGGLALGAAPPPLPSGAPTAPRVLTTVGGAGRSGPSEARTLEGVASVEGSDPPPVVPRLSVPDLVSQFIECLGAARTPTDIAALDSKRVSSAILARTCPSAVSVRHANGRVSVYTRQPATLLKTQVWRIHTGSTCGTVTTTELHWGGGGWP